MWGEGEIGRTGVWERGTKLERELVGAWEGDGDGRRGGCGGERGILSCIKGE